MSKVIIECLDHSAWGLLAVPAIAEAMVRTSARAALQSTMPQAHLRPVERRRHRPAGNAAAVDPVLHRPSLRPAREVEQQVASFLAPTGDREVFASGS